MIIEYKTPAAEQSHIPYEVSGKKVIFDDDLSINLSKREKDDPVHIDVCYDEDGELCIGAAAGPMWRKLTFRPGNTSIPKSKKAKNPNRRFRFRWIWTR